MGDDAAAAAGVFAMEGLWSLCLPVYREVIARAAAGDIGEVIEGVASVERDGYAALQSLGAPRPTRVFTAGGGASNGAWTKIRSTMLGVPITEAATSDASVGAARIAAGLIEVA